MKKILMYVQQLFGALRHRVTDRSHHQPVNYANIKALLLHLCDFDEDKCLWVMRWLAYPLRNPGAKMSRALLVAGPEGTGKHMFFERIVMELYADGAHKFRHPVDTTTIWPTGTRLAILDGVLSKGYQDRLKHLVTATDLPQRNRGATTVRRPNRMNFIMISGMPGALQVDPDQRRFCVIDAPAPMPPAFYRSVEYEIQSDGIEAFLDFLMRDLDMSDFDALTPPPMSRAPAMAA